MFRGSYRNSTKLYPQSEYHLSARMDYSTPNLPSYILSLPGEDQEGLLRGMVKTIERIMRTAYSSPHSQLLPQPKLERKGYVAFSDIFRLEQFSAYLQSVDLRALFQEEHEDMWELLIPSIKKISRTLWTNPGGVRLLSVHGIDKIYPVCFENYDHSNNCVNFQNLLSQLCSITSIQYNTEQGWAIVYTNQPEKLLQLDEYEWYDADNDQQCYMRVVTEQNLQRAKQSFLEISSYIKHTEMYRATVSEVMPCVRTFKTVNVRSTNKIKNAVLEELVNFRAPKEHYESCSIQNDGTFLVSFAEDCRVDQAQVYICQEQQSAN